MAESMAMKQQLIVLNRGKKRSPKLATSDRFLFGLLAVLIGGSRLKKIAVIIKPTTILAFHKSLVNRKYNRLYSNNTKKNPGRKPKDLFHRWKANLRVIDVEEIKTVPGDPTSHPFVERIIGSVRR